MKPGKAISSRFSKLSPLLSFIILTPLLLPACTTRPTPVSVAPITGLPQG